MRKLFITAALTFAVSRWARKHIKFSIHKTERITSGTVMSKKHNSQVVGLVPVQVDGEDAPGSMAALLLQPSSWELTLTNENGIGTVNVSEDEFNMYAEGQMYP